MYSKSIYYIYTYIDIFMIIHVYLESMIFVNSKQLMTGGRLANQIRMYSGHPLKQSTSLYGFSLSCVVTSSKVYQNMFNFYGI